MFRVESLPMSNGLCRSEFLLLVRRVYVRVVKVGNLFQVREDDVFVVTYDPRNIWIVEGFQVTFNDLLKVSAKFFLGFHQFFHYSSRGNSGSV